MLPLTPASSPGKRLLGLYTCLMCYQQTGNVVYVTAMKELLVLFLLR